MLDNKYSTSQTVTRSRQVPSPLILATPLEDPNDALQRQCWRVTLGASSAARLLRTGRKDRIWTCSEGGGGPGECSRPLEDMDWL